MTSSTQSSTTNTTTTITSPPSTTPSEPSTTTPTTLAETPPKPFRLLDLPFELVSQILEHSIEGVSSETEPIEISFSSSSSSCITTTTTPVIEEGENQEKTTTTPIIEEEDEGEKGEKGEKTTREEKEESESIPLGINPDIIEMKYPHDDNKSHPGIFQTCRILRSEALHIHLSKSFFTFPFAGPGIRGIRLDDAAAAEKKNLVDEVYLKMREELLAGRNGMLRGRRGEEEEVGLGADADADLKKDVVW